MTVIPGHLLDMAAAADRTAARVRPDEARRIAALILQHIPPDEHAVVEHRRAVVAAHLYRSEDRT